MQFTYQARDAEGQIRNGELGAANAEAASQQLRQDGLYLLSLEEAAAEAGNINITLFQKKVSRMDIIYLSNQLAVMTDAGVPLATALEGLAKQAENPQLKSMLTDIQQAVEGGDEFSIALARFPKCFDKAYVNLVKASEASGTLGAMLERISIQSQNDQETRAKVKGAMIYPGAMMLMCAGVSIFLLTYVFPKLTPMFATRSMDIPGPTKFMMWLSESLTSQWYFYIIGGGLLVFGFLSMKKKPWGRKALDWFWLHVPILGTMFRKVSISRSIRTLATTINAGVPVLEALELSSAVSNNIFYEECWLQVADQVAGGQQIYEALEGNTLFPATLIQMISSGEQTGKLGLVLDKVSDYYDKEVANAVKASTSLIEPVMVFIMGGVIGTIALAMLLPIFKLSSPAH
jgi:type IV pilus assembly protein PilC